MILRKLRENPLQYFQDRTDPYSLYAQKKWLITDEALIAGKIKEYSDKILKEQDSGGSWNGSIPETLRMMFFLHLTKREGGEYAEKALSYLESFYDSGVTLNEDAAAGDADAAAEKYFYDMPFLSSPFRRFFPCALYFTASVFGYASSGFYKNLFLSNRDNLINQPEGLTYAEKYNYLRASLVDPVYNSDSLAMQFVRDFKEMLEGKGIDIRDSDMFQIFNVLAHSSSPDARSAVERLLPLIIDKQNSDGSWGSGGSNPLSTFLVVHGLKNTGYEL